MASTSPSALLANTPPTHLQLLARILCDHEAHDRRRLSTAHVEWALAQELDELTGRRQVPATVGVLPCRSTPPSLVALRGTIMSTGQRQWPINMSGQLHIS